MMKITLGIHFCLNISGVFVLDLSIRMLNVTNLLSLTWVKQITESISNRCQSSWDVQ